MTRLSIIILSLIVALWSSDAAAACGFTEACAVRGASCVDGSCRLAVPGLMFPAQHLGTPIEQLEPGDRAVVGSTPRFRWVYPDGVDLLAVAIFRKLPKYVGNKASQVNGDQVVWVWLSSANGGAGAAVAEYESGRQYSQPTKEEACTAAAPPPLEPGIYYWAAWGWQAGSLKAKSRIFTFSVNADPITGEHCSTNADCGDLPGAACADDKFFCTLGCASDLDCFSNQICDLTPLTSGKASGVCRSPVGCQCAENETCDTDFQICYRGTKAHSGEASCDCGDIGTGKSTSNLCLPLLGLVTLAGRTRARRRRGHDTKGSPNESDGA